jgi:hypothetical protein
MWYVNTKVSNENIASIVSVDGDIWTYKNIAYVRVDGDMHL